MSLLITSLVVILVSAYLRLTAWLWIVIFATLLTAFSYFTDMSSLTMTLSWSFFTLVLVLFALTPLRRNLISNKLFSLYKKLLPKMSTTEKEALEAGTVWWDAELFSGKPNWKKLYSLPKPKLSAEEQVFLDGPVEEVCNMLDDWKISNEDFDLPEEVWEFLKQEHFFAMIIPKQFGGLEFSTLAHSAVVMKLSTRSITAAVSVMVPNSLGPGVLLLEYGTEEQKKYYLPRLASGAEIPCFALTAPDAGSDAGGMTDQGIVCRSEFEGKQNVLGIRLTWNKRFITLGPIATLLGLAFKLYDPEHLLGNQEDIGITLALIPTTHPGVNIGRRHLPANIPFQNGPNSGKDVFIPMDWVIGGQDKIGQGWRMLMECLSDGRGISLPALSTGAGKLASRTTGAYARIRRQFNMPIGEFEGVQEVLARIAGLTYMMDASRVLTLTALDQGEKPSVITAIIKYHLTESMRQLINDAVDVHGGKAVMLGPNNYLASVYQSIPIGITVEGANILTRNMIIFGQGAIRCHPYVLKEMQAVAEDDEKVGLKQFDKVIFAHIGFVISNVVRAFLLGISNARLHRPPYKDVTARYYQQIMRLSAVFALLADVSMIILGGSLKRRESLSARLGDILSNLYLASAVLKHFQDQNRPEADQVLLEWSCQNCFYNAQEAISEFLNNFPNRLIALLLRGLIFSFGRPFSKPKDKLNSAIAKLILSPSAARDRLTEGMFIPTSDDQSICKLEQALVAIIDAEPLMNNITTAMRKGDLKAKILMDAVDEAVDTKLILESEAKIIRTAIQLRNEVIAVDDFNPDDFGKKETVWQSQKQAAQSI